ncbi:Crp/Fnr family transcriptional regulator [Variovorax sp. PvP013]|uniref:Crp/Fnr family transcriptional regulator n=1 Tax=Variovorax sp. PvP013 TaxID=3156435 RepID=UPI003D207D1C
MIAVSLARRNRLLAAMPDDVLDDWLPHFELVELPFGTVLYDDGQPLSHIYFPVDALISYVQPLEDGSVIELAVIGNEGMVGVSVVLGSRTASGCAMAQVAGTSLRIDASEVVRRLGNESPVQELFCRFLKALVSQMAQTAACSRRHSLEQQLSRWLLMAQDRLPPGDMKITQETMAMMLGVRRESVTDVALRLQGTNLISYTRGRIMVVDRPGLEMNACRCYDFVAKRYEHLLPAK